MAADQINDGGPAFPSHNLSQNQSTGATTVYEGGYGLSLRDYFAAKALPALCAGQGAQDWWAMFWIGYALGMYLDARRGLHRWTASIDNSLAEVETLVFAITAMGKTA